MPRNQLMMLLDMICLKRKLKELLLLALGRKVILVPLKLVKLFLLLFQVAPSPNAYNIPSDFDKQKPRALAYSFGISRDAYKKVYLKNSPVRDGNIPGPGNYDIKNGTGSDSKKISMLGKTFYNPSSKVIPGPGAYSPKPSISPSGSHFDSRFKSSLAPSFSSPSIAS